MSKSKKFQPVANEGYIVAMRGLRASGAAGTHGDKREKRARTRGAATLRALREQGS